jgi:lysophospholipase L1-like esterase
VVTIGSAQGLHPAWRGLLLRRISLTLVSGLVSLLALEGALRIGARLALRERGQIFHPELGWQPAPNLRKVGRYWGVREPAWTNSRGWRDAETPFAKPPGVRRIVALGDSFTFGMSVDYGERFTEVLERTFPRTEVINLGVNAYGTDQELRMLELEGLRYQPDVVLLTAFLLNDLEDIRYERRFSFPRPHYEMEGGGLRLVRPEFTWDVRVRTASYAGEIGLRLVDRFLPRDRPAASLRDADTVLLFLALVQRMDGVAREHGARLLVLIAGRTPRPGDRDRVLAGLARAGIPMLDLAEVFARSPGPEARLFTEDGHWSREGHRVVAAAVARELATRGWPEERPFLYNRK